VKNPEIGDGFRLEVPLDASGIKGFKPDRAVKVLAIDARGHTWIATVALDPKGKGIATFHLTEAPGNLRVVVGPESATEKQMKMFRGLCAEVAADRWEGCRNLKIPPIPISAFYWWWWLAPPRVRPQSFLE